MKFAVDSRFVEEGSLFFALPGAKTDGHHFLEEVAKRGGKGAVVSQSYTGPSYGLELFPVEDVYLELKKRGQEHLKKHPNCRVIGITGSLGKTTTKEFLVHLLKEKFKVMFSEKSFNSKLSLPLVLLNHLRTEHEVAILEMGMSHPGNIHNLVEIAPPDLAVVTKVALVHAENFSNLEEIAREKFSIIVPEKTQTAIFPNEWVRYVPDGIKKRPIEELPLVPLPFRGEHFRENLMVAAAVALELGMTIQEINERIPTLSLPEKRCEEVEKNGVTFISDCYNASADSTIAALNLISSASPRRVGILGSMLELGPFSEGEHRRVGHHSLRSLDFLFCLGRESLSIADVWKEAGTPVEHYLDRQELEKRLATFLEKGDTVLVKGSNSLKMWEIIENWEGK